MRSSPSNCWRARVGMALATLVGAWAIVGASAAWAGGPFERLAGGWSGSGRVTFEGGQSERLRCNANYRPSGSGSRLGLSIRCASPSNAFELLGDLTHRGNRVSGSWQERTLGASGSIQGRASPSRIAVRFTGTAEGSMSVSTSGSRQTVTITSYGTALRAINVSLRRR